MTATPATIEQHLLIKTRSTEYRKNNAKNGTINYSNKNCQLISQYTVWRLDLCFQKDVHFIWKKKSSENQLSGLFVVR